METRLPGLMTVVDDWPDLNAVQNVLRYVTEGHQVLLLSSALDADHMILPYAVIVPVEEYRKLVDK